MRLLLDQNLSPKLASRLRRGRGWDVSGVRTLGLEDATDREIWTFAKREGYAIVSNDIDFVDLATIWGAPPKIISLRYGNATTAGHEAKLLGFADAIAAFLSDDTAATLALH